MEAFHGKVAPGVTGVELVAHVEYAVMTKGTGQDNTRRVRAFAQVATGPAETSLGFRPMEIATTRKMVEEDLALLELAVVADGFWCDRTRVAVAGAPTDQQREVFEAVVRAQEAAIAAVRSGVRAGEVDEAARALIREAGYDEGFFHVTGHGLGFRYHEPAPLIAPGSEEILETGMCHTVEPGVYLPAIGGIRVEDNVVVTENGAEVLGPFRKELC
jgi:Xaa-Pro dipeptidase